MRSKIFITVKATSMVLSGWCITVHMQMTVVPSRLSTCIFKKDFTNYTPSRGQQNKKVGLNTVHFGRKDSRLPHTPICWCLVLEFRNISWGLQSLDLVCQTGSMA
jgi:hypothetical protein